MLHCANLGEMCCMHIDIVLKNLATSGNTLAQRLKDSWGVG